jgi:hypothetical protein
MSTNWGKQLKQLALTLALALTLFGPVDFAQVRDTRPGPPTWVKLPPGAVEPQVNWNS